MTALPTLEQTRSWVGVPADVLPDADLQRMLGSAIEVVGRSCRVPLTPEGGPDTAAEWSDSLVSSVLRRVQRSIATKGLPLGYVDASGEYGPARIPAYDVQIEELEGPFRKVVFG